MNALPSLHSGAPEPSGEMETIQEHIDQFCLCFFGQRHEQILYQGTISQRSRRLSEGDIEECVRF